MNRTTALFLSLVIIASSTVSKAEVVTTENLLINPGAETGNLVDGWTIGTLGMDPKFYTTPFVDPTNLQTKNYFNSGIKPRTGNFDFVGGGDKKQDNIIGTTYFTSTLYQTVTWTSVPEITNALIDANGVNAHFSFYEQSLEQHTNRDRGFVSLTFLGSGNNVVLGMATSDELASTGGWIEYSSASIPVPTGTRSIDYTMNFIRRIGQDTDVYFDDNSLKLSYSASAVPEPSSLVLLSTGALAICAFKRRRKRVENLVG